MTTRAGVDRSPGEVTRLLTAWQSGEPNAVEQLMRLILGELRRMAAGFLAGERPGHTLQPTALVNEVYLRLVQQTAPWRTRSHFFAVAAQMTRRVLTDHARRALSVKRGSGQLVPLDEARQVALDRPDDLAALDIALELLGNQDPLKARIVEYRYFGGMTGEEIAEVEQLSPATVQRHWQIARAWLYRELAPGADDHG